MLLSKASVHAMKNLADLGVLSTVDTLSVKSTAKLFGIWGTTQVSGMHLQKSLIFVCLVQTEGRQLPLEKITLGSTSFQSSPQADWGQQAVKEQVITPVPLRNWLVLYVNRDKSKALDFVTMMNKVTPAMGIEVCVLPSATSKVITSHLAMFISLSSHALGNKSFSTTILLTPPLPPSPPGQFV